MADVVELTMWECKQARQGLDWSRDQLSAASGIGKRTIIDFENGVRSPLHSTLLALKKCLEGEGVVFSANTITIPTKPINELENSD